MPSQPNNTKTLSFENWLYKSFLWQVRRWVFVFLSILASCSLVTNYFKIGDDYHAFNLPSFGIFLTFTTFSILIFWQIYSTSLVKLFSKSLFQTLVWLINTVFFSLLFVVKDANPLLFFFNFLTLIYSITYLVQSSKTDQKWNLVTIISAPFSLFLEIIKTPNFFRQIPQELREKEAEKTKSTFWQSILSSPKTRNEILLGLIWSLLLVMFVVPLLASTNPIFADLMRNIINLLNLSWLEDFLISLMFGLAFWQVLFGLFLYWILPKIFSLVAWNLENGVKVSLEIVQSENLKDTGSKENLTNTDKNEADQKADQKEISQIEINKPEEETQKYANFQLSFLTPKTILIITFLLYFVSQVGLYLISRSDLEKIGYGRLNNEIFTQLSLVCLIVFGLLIIDKYRHKFHQISSILLLIQSAFLGIIATKSVVDYMLTFGLTFKRLYGVVVVIFIFANVGFFGYHLLKNLTENWLFKRLVYLVVILLIGVNLVNFDGLIYQNMPRETDGIDYGYLTSLSLDSGAFDQIALKISEARKNYLQTVKYIGDVETPAPNLTTTTNYGKDGLSTGMPVLLPIAPQIPTKISSQNPRNTDNFLPTASTQPEIMDVYGKPTKVATTFNSKAECEKIAKSCRAESEKYMFESQYILAKYQFLKYKYENFSWQTWQSFNLTEWQTWQKIKEKTDLFKDIDKETYR
jgi:hypothetical protein